MLSGSWGSPMWIHRIPLRGLCNLTEPFTHPLADLFLNIVTSSDSFLSYVNVRCVNLGIYLEENEL